MEKEIYSIILGNNQDELYGSENDAILIYNLFYTFYLKKSIWKKPIIYLNKDVNIENIINSIKSINNNSIIILYFSGHSCKYGNLQFYNKLYSNTDILNYFSDKKNIYFIIDSCYGKKFIDYNVNSMKLKYIVSTSDIQKSKEIIIDYNNEMFLHKKLLNYNTKIAIGMFTLYFYRILKNKNLYNILEWKTKVLNNKIWDIIDKRYNQKIFYYENIR